MSKFSWEFYVLLTLGPIMMVDFSVSGILLNLASHLDRTLLKSELLNDESGFKLDSLTPLLITFFIPFYLCLLRSFICDYIPGVFK